MVKNLLEIRNAVILIVICFSLTGCLDIEYHLQIKPDGTESVTCKVGMPAFFAGQSGEIAKSMEEDGYKVNIETEGDKHYVTGTQNYPKGQWVLPYPSKFVKGEVTFEPSYLNLLVLKKYSLKAKFALDKDEVNNFISDTTKNIYTQNIRIPFRYVISVPGNISKYNSDEITGNRLVWKYTIRPNEQIDIQLVSYDINYPAIIVIVLFLIGLSGLFIFRISRRRSKRENYEDIKNKQQSVDRKRDITKEKLKNIHDNQQSIVTEREIKGPDASRFKNREEYERWRAGRSGRTEKKMVNTKYVLVIALGLVICLAIGLFYGLNISKQRESHRGITKDLSNEVRKIEPQIQFTKAKLIEATNAISTVASAVEAYHQDLNTWPYCDSIVSIRTSLGVSISTDKISSITVTSPKTEEVTITAIVTGIDSEVNGKTLSLMGTSRENEAIRWIWSGTVPSIYIPKQ